MYLVRCRSNKKQTVPLLSLFGLTRQRLVPSSATLLLSPSVLHRLCSEMRTSVHVLSSSHRGSRESYMLIVTSQVESQAILISLVWASASPELLSWNKSIVVCCRLKNTTKEWSRLMSESSNKSKFVLWNFDYIINMNRSNCIQCRKGKKASWEKNNPEVYNPLLIVK